MIGNCDNCDRHNVPVRNLTGTYVGDTTQCYLCTGDTDPDPYGELEATPDPTALTCERCGATVHDPCQTDEAQARCDLPDFCFRKSVMAKELGEVRENIR